MNKSYIIIFVTIILIIWLLIIVNYKNNKNTEVTITSEKNLEYSFDIKNCNKILIQSFNQAADEKPNKEIIITDIKTINDIISKLSVLPKEWDEYIKMAWNISYLKLIFIWDKDKNYIVEYYWWNIKTPWTSFYSEEKEESKYIYNLIKKLLN